MKSSAVERRNKENRRPATMQEVDENAADAQQEDE